MSARTKERARASGQVLLLNASFEPLNVISWKRAVELVLSGEVDVLEETDDPVRSQHLAMQRPSVVRLRYFVKLPWKETIPLTRRAVVARDGGRCAFVDQPRARKHPQCTVEATTIDHVVPRSKGGPHRWENVVAACRACNGHKDDRTLADLGWTLPFTPKAPRGTMWLALGNRLRPDWEPYLGI